MTQTKFGTEMTRMTNLARGPFAAKERYDGGIYYPHRAHA
jgi:hypothetical protein